MKIRHFIFAVAYIFLINSAFARSDQQNITQKLIGSWFGCVKESFGFQLKTLADRNLAAENAFLACASEENAVFVPIRNNPDLEYKYRVLMRSRAKQSLFNSQPITAPKPKSHPNPSDLPIARKLTEEECMAAKSLQTIPGQTSEDSLILGYILKDNGC